MQFLQSLDGNRRRAAESKEISALLFSQDKKNLNRWEGTSANVTQIAQSF